MSLFAFLPLFLALGNAPSSRHLKYGIDLPLTFSGYVDIYSSEKKDEIDITVKWFFVKKKFTLTHEREGRVYVNHRKESIKLPEEIMSPPEVIDYILNNINEKNPIDTLEIADGYFDEDDMKSYMKGKNAVFSEKKVGDNVEIYEFKYLDGKGEEIPEKTKKFKVYNLENGEKLKFHEVTVRWLPDDDHGYILVKPLHDDFEKFGDLEEIYVDLTKDGFGNGYVKTGKKEIKLERLKGKRK